MSLEYIKKEVQKEIEAVRVFIELAILAQQAGHEKAAQFFLAEAKEDCEHAFLYATELDKHHVPSKSDKNIVDITDTYHQLEAGAIERIEAMYKDAKNKEMASLVPFINEMMSKHSADCYRAKKLLQKIEVLFPTGALCDIESLFEEATQAE
ncbi:MAG: hypothetical protein ACRCVN_01380 [Spirochaetia bacterium]